MQDKYITKRKKGKHLTEAERAKIEVYLKEGKTKKYIAECIGVSERTIYREIKRGKIALRNSDYTEREEYCYDVAQRRYEENQKKKEGYLKIGNNHDLANFIEDMIITKRVSPYVALLLAKKMENTSMHKFCSYEKGSNENNNKLIRRFIEKGVDIGKFSKKRIKEIEKFMNDYPRKMFGGLSSNEVYKSLEKKL